MHVFHHASLPLSISFLNCSLSEKVGFLLRDTQTRILPSWGISISKKAKCECRQLCSITLPLAKL